MADEERMVGFGRVGQDAQTDIDKSKGGASILDEPDFGGASAYRRKEEERREINKAIQDKKRSDRQHRIMYRKALRAGDTRAAAAVYEKQKDFGAARMAGDDAVAAGERIAQKEGALEKRPGAFNADQKALREDWKNIAGVDTSTAEGQSIAMQVFEGREGTRTAHDRRKLLRQLAKDPDFKKNLPGVRYLKDAFDPTKDATDAAGNKVVDTGQTGPTPAKEDPAGGRGPKGKEGEKGKKEGEKEEKKEEEEEEEEEEKTDVSSGYGASGGRVDTGAAESIAGVMDDIRGSLETSEGASGAPGAPGVAGAEEGVEEETGPGAEGAEGGPGKPAVNIEGMRDLLNQDPEVQMLAEQAADPVTREALANQDFGSSMATEFPALQKFVERAETPSGKAILESMERIDRIARGMDPDDTSRAVERKSNYLSTLGEPGGPAVTRQPALRNTEEAQNLRKKIGNEEFLKRYEPVYNRESGEVSYIPRNVDKPRPARMLYQEMSNEQKTALFDEYEAARDASKDNPYMQRWLARSLPGDLQSFHALNEVERKAVDKFTSEGHGGIIKAMGRLGITPTLRDIRESQASGYPGDSEVEITTEERNYMEGRRPEGKAPNPPVPVDQEGLMPRKGSTIRRRMEKLRREIEAKNP